MADLDCKRVRRNTQPSLLDDAINAVIIFGVLTCLCIVSSGLNEGTKEIAEHDPVAQYLVNVQKLVAGE